MTIAIGAALLVFATACGGGEKEPARSLSLVAAAAEKSTDAGSARFSLTLRTEGLQVPGSTAQAVTFAGDGAFDYEAKRGRIAFDLGELGALFGQQAGGGKIEMIFDGNVFYMRFPLLSQLLGSGKPWIKVDAEKLSRQEGVDLGQLRQLEQGDPTQALAYLRAAGDFTEVGTEPLRGVETTHYRGTIDLRKALEQAPQEQREEIDKLVEQGGVEELPAEAWIDGDGLLRKMTIEFAKIPDQPQASMSMTMELYDYGAEVEVEPPPADEVTDLSELVQTESGTESATVPPETK